MAFLLIFIIVERMFTVTILGPTCLLVAPLTEEKVVPIFTPLTVFTANTLLVLVGGATPPYLLTLEPLVSYIIKSFPPVVHEVEVVTKEARLLNR